MCKPTFCQKAEKSPWAIILYHLLLMVLEAVLELKLGGKGKKKENKTLRPERGNGRLGS